MRLSNGNPGHVLTQAYGINKSSPYLGVFDPPKKRVISARQRVIYDNAKKSERLYVVDTPHPRTTGKQTLTKRDISNKRVVDLMEAGHIIGAAEGGGIGFKYWSRFAYDPDHGNEWLEAGSWLSDQLFKAHVYLNKRKHKLPLSKLSDLAMLCVVDTAHRCANGNPKFKLDDMAHYLGYKDANSANWSRTIAPHFNFMSAMLDRHNGLMLGKVSKAIKELQDATSYDVANNS